MKSYLPSLILSDVKGLLLVIQLLTSFKSFRVHAAGLRGTQELVTQEIGYGVDIYTCSAEFERIEGTSSIAKANGQGHVYNLCFEPNENARQDGVGIKSIDSFTWQRGDCAEQISILGGQAAVLSQSICGVGTDHRLCSLETLLGAAFYRTEGTIAAFGTATLTTGDIQVPLKFEDWNLVYTEVQMISNTANGRGAI